MNSLELLYEVVKKRQQTPEENSYTCYLFEQGIDKICKKVGEEAAETIIAAKNGVAEETVGEVADLLYHLMVLLVAQGIPLEKVDNLLMARGQKIGNLKTFHQSDHNS